MPPSPELLTERLRLRHWRPEDEVAIAINRDPEVTRYLNRPAGPGATAAFYARATEHWAEHGFGWWALESREPDLAGQLIGFAGVSYPTFLPELATRPELGWRLARHTWGRGLASEAASRARDHAFDTIGLTELISIIHPDNARSRCLATKLGMTVSRQVRHPVLNRDVEVWRATAPSSCG